jgi:DNA anti-recombination protein RmuC
MSDDKNGNGLDLTNRELLETLMSEIADVRRALKEDIANLDHKLTNRIDKMDSRIDKMDNRIDKMDSKIDNLTIKVDQNHIALIKNTEDLDTRVTKLEVAVS